MSKYQSKYAIWLKKENTEKKFYFLHFFLFIFLRFIHKIQTQWWQVIGRERFISIDWRMKGNQNEQKKHLVDEFSCENHCQNARIYLCVREIWMTY